MCNLYLEGTRAIVDLAKCPYEFAAPEFLNIHLKDLSTTESPIKTIRYEEEIVVEHDGENATITTVNFLNLVESGRLDGATFYRVVTPDNQPGDGVKIEVIQGGLGGNPAAEDTKPIEHETTKATGLRHLAGTISGDSDAMFGFSSG